MTEKRKRPVQAGLSGGEIVENYEVAAKWWADWLRKEEPAPIDYGSTDPFGLILMRMSRGNPEFSPEMVDRYEALLARHIRRLMRTRQWLPGYAMLTTDYSPSRPISFPARLIGLKIDNKMPLKTGMWVYADYIEVRVGYGARPEIIWEHPFRGIARELGIINDH